MKMPTLLKLRSASIILLLFAIAANLTGREVRIGELAIFYMITAIYLEMIEK
ncbi:hypothetical protein [Brevibacillus laterosporus]|uniref:Uncharacterized protein n=1 Tax=Brevibacillus laterosporus TaxID=1465 RepID=A0AAP3DDE6_BRELA|nr:hypothetical protein [Brevibacillus laterosporus]MCR8978700.1 hypothetical protein [Brevibacillus laterosporus]MCZ0805856.1 hypothetical protein [Brevibacillus laterosporus]MCZ0824378.1 hypothetical protein [Brevibacillus laterosporus]MCZ0848282.1 hypothetical protein [Brevibacillus laterosporus]